MTDCMDARQREATLEQLNNSEFDLVVVGGGITGAGILREAALRGLSVALLECDDYASGTSSKSTKLIHGGIRYLAMGHVHIVRQTSRERKRVHRLAPHLAEPMNLMLPADNLWTHLKYRVGVTTYEYLGQVDSGERHVNLGGQSLSEEEPQLDTANFPYACVYREYLTEDARLVLANLRAGVNAGGISLNYARVTGLIKEGSKTRGVQAVCGRSGREIVVRSNVVINAAGPWVGSINEQNGLASSKSIVLSKGVHIVVSGQRLPLNHPVMMVSSDHRPVFAIPKDDVVYIGTTDTAWSEDASHWPCVHQQDIEYLFEPVKRYFDIQLEMSDCLASWAGLRPLISEPGKSTKDISRKDEVWVSDSGLITIAGGKLTGYRKMAEDTVDKAVHMLDVTAKINAKENAPAPDLPLPGGDFNTDLDTLVRMFAERTKLAHRVLERLVRLYGNECDQVIALGDQALVSTGLVLEGEIIWAVRSEGATTLVDTLYRRTRAAVYRPTEVLDLVDPAADLMAAELGWDPTRRVNEIKAFRDRFLADARMT
ncbi:MAG: glycerol-3-phosphate dehydrogenase/oxidase [Pseudomonadales bacterium]